MLYDCAPLQVLRFVLLMSLFFLHHIILHSKDDLGFFYFFNIQRANKMVVTGTNINRRKGPEHRSSENSERKKDHNMLSTMFEHEEIGVLWQITS